MMTYVSVRRDRNRDSYELRMILLAAPIVLVASPGTGFAKKSMRRE